jgi:hypothetical protein
MGPVRSAMLCCTIFFTLHYICAYCSPAGGTRGGSCSLAEPDLHLLPQAGKSLRRSGAVTENRVLLQRRPARSKTLRQLFEISE